MSVVVMTIVLTMIVVTSSTFSFENLCPVSMGCLEAPLSLPIIKLIDLSLQSKLFLNKFSSQNICPVHSDHSIALLQGYLFLINTRVSACSSGDEYVFDRRRRKLGCWLNFHWILSLWRNVKLFLKEFIIHDLKSNLNRLVRDWLPFLTVSHKLIAH